MRKDPRLAGVIWMVIDRQFHKLGDRTFSFSSFNTDYYHTNSLILTRVYHCNPTHSLVREGRLRVSTVTKSSAFKFGWDLNRSKRLKVWRDTHESTVSRTLEKISGLVSTDQTVQNRRTKTVSCGRGVQRSLHGPRYKCVIDVIGANVMTRPKNFWLSIYLF